MRHRPGKRKKGVPLWFVITAAFLALQFALLYPAFRHFTSFCADTIQGDCR